MNRERQLAGVNSYARVLGFDPVDWLAGAGAGADAGAEADAGAQAGAEAGAGAGVREPAWLDLCCGSGRALVQAAGRLRGASIVGVDLVDAFVTVPAGIESSVTVHPESASVHPESATVHPESATVHPESVSGSDSRLSGDTARPDSTFAGRSGSGAVRFVVAPVEFWSPSREFDLITCVHGLHYVGDKLGVLGRVVRWLKPGGRFVADLDLESVRVGDGRAVGRRLVAQLRAAGLTYDTRRRRISCDGPVELDLPYAYLGADDRAGPNYTGQPAVHSFYQPI